MIVIVDYGMGNLGSILNRLERLDVQASISGEADQIRKADKLVLPGVGFFATGIANLKERGLVPVLEDKVLRQGTPILGICLGMQLFTKRSEEGDADGLGWIDGETKKLDVSADGNTLRIPHMGWNSIKRVNESPLLANLTDEASFYFVHSFCVHCNDPANVVATTRYGSDFVSVVQKGNICGTQFHPEKSHQDGIELLRNFVRGA